MYKYPSPAIGVFEAIQLKL